MVSRSFELLIHGKIIVSMGLTECAKQGFLPEQNDFKWAGKWGDGGKKSGEGEVHWKLLFAEKALLFFFFTKAILNMPPKFYKMTVCMKYSAAE